RLVVTSSKGGGTKDTGVLDSWGAGTRAAPPPPLQGERVGVRGSIRESFSCGGTPHPDPLPARAGRGSADIADNRHALPHGRQSLLARAPPPRRPDPPPPPPGRAAAPPHPAVPA